MGGTKDRRGWLFRRKDERRAGVGGFEGIDRRVKQRRFKEERRSGTQRRTDCRLIYDDAQRPCMVIDGGATFEVLDIAERGLRISLSDSKISKQIKGKIVFIDGFSLEIDGKVVRAGNGEVSIKLEQIIPAKRLLEEKRNLQR